MDAAARLSYPNQFAQKAAGLLSGEGARGKGKPLEEYTGNLGRLGANGTIWEVYQLTNEQKS